MDADGLPIIGPSVDYRKVDPINQKRTVSFLNHFVIHTAGFLNRFSTVCEEKLAHLSTRLQRLETQMTLLEGKLSSVPGLDDVTVASTQKQSHDLNQTTSSQDTAPTQVTQQQANNPPSQTNAHPESKEVEPALPVEKPTNTVSKHPSYAKFFKMLTVGVPPMGVKQKMVGEGLNPDYLDTPNAPAPDASAPESAQDDTESDFSEPEDGSTDDSLGFSD